MSHPPHSEASLTDLIHERLMPFPRDHFLSAGDLNAATAPALLDLADAFVDFNRGSTKAMDLMRGRTVVNLFFENSTRTSSSFEIAAKRLGADVVNMSPRTSSVAKGETLIDTAVTLNAMRPDLLVVRHASSGAAALLGWISGVDVGVVFHNHTHRRVFTRPWLNRWATRLWTVSGGWPGAYWTHAHVVVHHAELLEAGDWTVPRRRADGRFENIYVYLLCHWPWRYAVALWRDVRSGRFDTKVARTELLWFLAQRAGQVVSRDGGATWAHTWVMHWRRA
jgi:hypothetical protein